MNRFGRRAQLAAASAIAISLAACDDGRRQIDAPQPEPLAELAAISELPYAEPAPVEYAEPARGYQWAERAYGLQRTFYDAPPDYGLDYEWSDPWVWETADDWSLYAEPWDDGYRHYYYEPGADYPYFVRDLEYGYAFGAAGVLIAVFDSGGRYLPVDVAYRVAPLAGRYYERGHRLRSGRARRIRVDDRVWAQEAPRVTRSADPWLRGARDERAWRTWRERNQNRELERFTEETRRREVAAQQWRERAARQRLATTERPYPQWNDEARRPRDASRDPRQDRRIEADRARAEAQAQPRQTQAERQRARTEQRQQAQVEQRRQVQAQRQQAQSEQRRQAQAEQRRQGQAQRQQAQAEQRRQGQAQRQQAQVEQRRQGQAQRQQAQAEQRRQGQQAQVEQRRQGQAQRQQAQAEQRRQVQAQRQQAQAEQRRQGQAQRQQVQAEQRRQVQAQRQQAQAEQRRQGQAQRQQAQAEQRRQVQAQRQQAQKAARSAEQSGKSASAREQERGRGKKD